MRFIPIGATIVRSTVMLKKMADKMGYFAFGGSLIFLLFRQNPIIFDEDLRLNSRENLRTNLQVGLSLDNNKGNDSFKKMFNNLFE